MNPQLTVLTEVATSGMREHDLVRVVSSVDQRELEPV
jgi:hypothetical protein